MADLDSFDIGSDLDDLLISDDEAPKKKSHTDAAAGTTSVTAGTSKHATPIFQPSVSTSMPPTSGAARSQALPVPSKQLNASNSVDDILAGLMDEDYKPSPLAKPATVAATAALPQSNPAPSLVATQAMENLRTGKAVGSGALVIESRADRPTTVTPTVGTPRVNVEAKQPTHGIPASFLARFGTPDVAAVSTTGNPSGSTTLPLSTIAQPSPLPASTGLSDITRNALASLRGFNGSPASQADSRPATTPEPARVNRLPSSGSGKSTNSILDLLASDSPQPRRRATTAPSETRRLPSAGSGHSTNSILNLLASDSPELGRKNTVATVSTPPPMALTNAIPQSQQPAPGGGRGGTGEANIVGRRQTLSAAVPTQRTGAGNLQSTSASKADDDVFIPDFLLQPSSGGQSRRRRATTTGSGSTMQPTNANNPFTTANKPFFLDLPFAKKEEKPAEVSAEKQSFGDRLPFLDVKPKVVKENAPEVIINVERLPQVVEETEHERQRLPEREVSRASAKPKAEKRLPTTKQTQPPTVKTSKLPPRATNKPVPLALKKPAAPPRSDSLSSLAPLSSTTHSESDDSPDSHSGLLVASEDEDERTESDVPLSPDEETESSIQMLSLSSTSESNADEVASQSSGAGLLDDDDGLDEPTPKAVKRPKVRTPAIEPVDDKKIKELEEQVQLLRNELLRTGAQHQEEMVTVRTSHMEMVAQLKAQHSEELEDVKRQWREQVARVQAEKDVLMTQHAVVAGELDSARKRIADLELYQEQERKRVNEEWDRIHAEREYVVQQREGLGAGLDTERREFCKLREEWVHERRRILGEVERERSEVGKLKAEWTAKHQSLDSLDADTQLRVARMMGEVENERRTLSELHRELHGKVSKLAYDAAQLRSEKVMFSAQLAEFESERRVFEETRHEYEEAVLAYRTVKDREMELSQRAASLRQHEERVAHEIEAEWEKIRGEQNTSAKQKEGIEEERHRLEEERERWREERFKLADERGRAMQQAPSHNQVVQRSPSPVTVLPLPTNDVARPPTNEASPVTLLANANARSVRALPPSPPAPAVHATSVKVHRENVDTKSVARSLLVSLSTHLANLSSSATALDAQYEYLKCAVPAVRHHCEAVEFDKVYKLCDGLGVWS
ncbi:hypothetical protein HDU85_003707 [Gaertneriomyces sp. JEL0708]|nr:hypothetical protein HDU85_003707 [Gaertneriomyces sp. JEL0708]